MSVGLTVWEGRISPVFEAAQRLLVIETDGGAERARKEESLSGTFPPQRVSKLLRMNVRTLICGAISQPVTAMVNAAGIQLVPFVSGDVETVLHAYLAGQLPAPGFMMPGYRGGRRRRFRHGR